MSASPARLVAFRTLHAIRGGALADIALDRESRSLDARDRAWTQALVYGTLRLRGRLDHILAQHTRGRADADVRDILRLGAYQLLEMQSVPGYAAVSESVELAKAVRARAAGFVNGVLQSLGREMDHLEFPQFETDPIGFLTTWGSHPEWLVRRWIDRIGVAATKALVELNNERPPTFVHTLGAADAAKAALERANITVEPVHAVRESLRLVDASVLEALDAARIIVQDPAASLVVRYVSPPADARIVDMCAAPGGKTAALATSAPVPAYIVAGDVAPVRARRVARVIDRLGIPAGAVVADGRSAPFREADVVLLDAPCTGTGTLRRHPDARWRIRSQDLPALAALQRELLESAARIVRRDGILVYATCSLEAEENEDQVAAFLDRHEEFRIEMPPSIDDRFLDAMGCLRVLPHVHGFDGAFAARLRRG